MRGGGMRRVMVGLLVLVLCGCGVSKETDRPKKETGRPTTKVIITKEECDRLKVWGVFCGKNYEREVSIIQYIDAFLSKSLSDRRKSEYCGEYYIPQTKDSGWPGRYSSCGVYSGWHKFAHEKVSTQVNGFIRIRYFYEDSCGDNGYIWVPEGNIFYYKDVPDKYEAMRKEVEEKAKDLPEIKN